MTPSDVEASRTTVTIGLYVPLSGSAADLGRETQNGVALAVEEANSLGGLGHKQVRLVAEDDQGNTAEVERVVLRLIDQRGAVAILGGISANLAEAGARTCQSRRIPMITPSAAASTVTSVSDYVFRSCFVDSFEGDAMARFSARILHFDRVAILSDQNSTYSRSLAGAFRARFSGLGGTIADEQVYGSGDANFAVQLTSILAHNPQAIFLPGYCSHATLVAREARRRGFLGRILGGSGWAGASLYQNDENALVGDFYLGSYSAEDVSNSAAQNFARQYRQRYGTEPSSVAALGYDSAVVLFDAIRRAGALDSTAVRDSLARTSGIQGATGTISFNESRDAVKSVPIMEVTPDGVRYSLTVSPDVGSRPLHIASPPSQPSLAPVNSGSLQGPEHGRRQDTAHRHRHHRHR